MPAPPSRPGNARPSTSRAPSDHCSGKLAWSNGSRMSRRSRFVSTSTNGPSSTTIAGGRSRGILTGRGSAAIAAWTAAIFSASEFTHCSPDPSATWASSATGSSNGRTLGNARRGRRWRLDAARRRRRRRWSRHRRRGLRPGLGDGRRFFGHEAGRIAGPLRQHVVAGIQDVGTLPQSAHRPSGSPIRRAAGARRARGGRVHNGRVNGVRAGRRPRDRSGPHPGGYGTPAPHRRWVPAALRCRSPSRPNRRRRPRRRLRRSRRHRARAERPARDARRGPGDRHRARRVRAGLPRVHRVGRDPVAARRLRRSPPGWKSAAMPSGAVPSMSLRSRGPWRSPRASSPPRISPRWSGRSARSGRSPRGRSPRCRRVPLRRVRPRAGRPRQDAVGLRCLQLQRVPDAVRRRGRGLRRADHRGGRPGRHPARRGVHRPGRRRVLRHGLHAVLPWPRAPPVPAPPPAQRVSCRTAT